MRTKEYNTWVNIKQRCSNIKNSDYRNYGGRGICVCDRWSKSFSNFLKDMGYAPTANHTIERDDNDGNYEPSNCRWATRSEQRKNQRKAIKINIDGTEKTVWEWAEQFKIESSAVCRRIKLGWSPKDALLRPVVSKAHVFMISINGETKPISEWCIYFNIKHSTVWTRIDRGWDLVNAVITPLKRINKIKNVK